MSIGASRGRIISQLLTESLLLATLAAAVGLAIAPLASELLVRMTIGVDTGPLPFSVGVDGRVLAFTAIDHAAHQPAVRVRAGLARHRSVAQHAR